MKRGEMEELHMKVKALEDGVEAHQKVIDRLNTELRLLRIWCLDLGHWLNYQGIATLIEGK